MDAMTWLAAANIIVWLGIGGYVAFMAKNQKVLRMRIQDLALSRDENNEE